MPIPNPKFQISPPPRLRAIRHQPSALGRKAAFTLVESIVAIGLFAFVIVGILGLFGAALERQRQSSFETRSIMVSQQLLARIRAASSATNVWLTTGSDASNESKIFHSNNFSNISTNVIYYKRDGTEISGVLQPNNYEGTTFAFAGNRSDSQTNDIVGRARISLSTNSSANTGNATTANGTVITNLWRVTIEVSEPANLPLSARRYTNTFTTFATFPN